MKINLKIVLALYRIGTSKGLYNTKSREYQEISRHLDLVKNKENFFVSVSYIEALFSSLKQDKNDEEIGFLLGKGFRLFDLGMFGYYLYSSKTAFEGLSKIPQYEFLISDCIHYEIHIDEDQFIWESSLKALGHSISEQAFHIFSVFELTARYSIVNKLLQEINTPELIELINHTENDILQKQLCCPVKKDGLSNKIIYDISTLDKILQTSNYKINAALDMIIFSQIDGVGVYSKLASVYIKNNLEKLTFSIKDVAYYFKISERKLQRKLRQEGTNYQKLLTDIRKELTFFYKSRGMLTKDISAKLGYKEYTSFIRAYRGWSEAL